VATRLIIAILIIIPAAWSQSRLEVTAKIGAPMLNSFNTGSFSFLGTGFHQGSSATRRYTAGAGVELRLPHGLGAEVDMLYKRLGYDVNSNPSPDVPVAFLHTWSTANSWEFPVLGVYHPYHREHFAPRVSAGVSFRTISGASTSGQCYVLSSVYSQFCQSTAPVAEPADSHLNARSSFGGTFGAGIEMKAGLMRIVPEVRYTRWRADSSQPQMPFDLRSNPNQLDVLVGITF